MHVLRVSFASAYGRLLGSGLERRPTGFLWDPEDAVGPVPVWVFRVGAWSAGDQLGVVLLEGVGDER